MYKKKPEKEIHTKVMALTLDNIFRFLITNPKKLLENMGVKEGQRVLDVGCGPGFFTIPASKIVGENGIVFALDILPLMIKRIKYKIQRKNIKNIKTILADAKHIGLENEMIDVVIIIDTIADLGDLDSVLKEIHRVLKPNGILSVFEGFFGHWKPDKVSRVVQNSGLFSLIEKDCRILKFKKNVKTHISRIAHNNV